MKFFLEHIAPIGLYAIAFSLMDLNFGKELIIGFSFIVGAQLSVFAREHM